jgi:hypothetical protein
MSTLSWRELKKRKFRHASARDTAQGESIQQEGGRRGAEEPQLSQQLVLEAPYWISTSVPIGTEA